jgi:phosphatidylserine/phosphatidylglycerophosphate/cardiolipin synthase-like enzyme
MNAFEARQQGPQILDRLATARTRVWLVSPYLTSEDLLRAARASVAGSKRLLTRLNGADILAGATDLRLLVSLLGAGVHVHVTEDVHAKVYVIDDWAYVGSANLTTRGLAVSDREFGIASSAAEHLLEATAYFECVWNQAADLREEILDSMLNRLGCRSHFSAPPSTSILT